jgi:hypothetical protein
MENFISEFFGYLVYLGKNRAYDWFIACSEEGEIGMGGTISLNLAPDHLGGFYAALKDNNSAPYHRGTNISRSCLNFEELYLYVFKLRKVVSIYGTPTNQYSLEPNKIYILTRHPY